MKLAGTVAKASVRMDKLAENKMAFSQLLESASDHADKTANPQIFESAILRIIVQHKWQVKVRCHFHVRY